jgi:hypothetical protein
MSDSENEDYDSDGSPYPGDIDDPCFDHHFGMETRDAVSPYTNRGRTENKEM